jgi:hypothetical protein
MTASADDRQTRTPCSAPQMEKPDEMRNEILFSFLFCGLLEKTKEERMENQRVEKGSLPQA